MKRLLPRRGRAGELEPLRPGDPFWFLRDRDALVRRFVLSQALDEPRARRPMPIVTARRPGR